MQMILGGVVLGEKREEDQHHHKILQSFSLLLSFFSCLHFYFNKSFIYDLTFKDASALRDMWVRDPLGKRTIILHIGPERKKNGYTLNFLVSATNIDPLIEDSW